MVSQPARVLPSKKPQPLEAGAKFGRLPPNAKERINLPQTQDGANPWAMGDLPPPRVRSLWRAATYAASVTLYCRQGEVERSV